MGTLVSQRIMPAFRVSPGKDYVTAGRDGRFGFNQERSAMFGGDGRGECSGSSQHSDCSSDGNKK